MSAYLVSLSCVIGINLILALSLNIITGFCGQVSLGHAAFYGVGAYTAALAAKAGVPAAACLIGGTVVAGVAGTIVGLSALRVRHDFLAITTMGVGFIFLGVVRKQSWLGGELGISGIPDIGLGPLGYAAVVLACAAAVVLLSVVIKRSWLGFAFDGVADDEDAARTIGIDVRRYKLAAFAIGTALAGLAGGLYIYFAHIILPDTFDFALSIAILTTVVVGGAGSVWGVAAAAVLLTVLPELSRAVNDYRLLVFGAMLVLVMRFSPGGLAGVLANPRPWVRAR